MRDQTSLPSDMTKPSGKPSSALGFTDNTYTGRAKQTNSNGQPVKTPQGNILTRMQTFSIVTSTVPAPFLAENNSRNYLLIQNNGGSTVYISFGGTPSVTGAGSIVLSPGSNISFDNGIVPNNNAMIISSGSNLVSVIEGSRVN